MLNFIHWNFDPVAFTVFGLEIRWYGVMFMLTFLCGWWILNRIFKREGRNPELALDGGGRRLYGKGRNFPRF